MKTVTNNEDERRAAQRRERWRSVGGGIALAAIAVAIAALMWPRNRPAELGESFRLDLAALKRVDPARLMGRERPPVPTPVAGARALAVDAENRIYVGGESEIAVLAPDGRLIRRLPVDRPVTCLAVMEPGGEIVVGHRDRIVVLENDGGMRAAWSPPGSNAVLTSVAVAGEELFVADAGRRLVWRFSSDGRLLARIGERDLARDWPGFVIPSASFDLAIAPGGALWVVDPGRQQLVQFAPNGDPVSFWQRQGFDIESFSGCCNPAHIAIRADGSFVTCEKGIVRIKILSAAGNLLGVLAGPDRFDEDAGGLDLAVDGAGRILALDADKGRILVFETEDE